MRIIPLKLVIILLFLSSINFLYANEKEDFNIGYYDLEKDIRYDEWGVHPVDIRSKSNQLYKRPLAGAKLGLKDMTFALLGLIISIAIAIGVNDELSFNSMITTMPEEF